jgi:hypothetical protein
MAESGNLTSEQILQQYETSTAEARQANEQRYQQGMGILDQAIQRYQPGGSFGAGAMAQYEQGKTQAMAQGMQSLVNSGLSNTTMAAGMPLAYEQEVGTPFRLQLNDMRMQNLTDAEKNKTDFISAREDPYPDFGMFANLAMQAGQLANDTWSGTTTTYGTGPFPSDQPGYDGIMNAGQDGGVSAGSFNDLLSQLGAGGGSQTGGGYISQAGSSGSTWGNAGGGTTSGTSGSGMGGGSMTINGKTYTMGFDEQGNQIITDENGNKVDPGAMNQQDELQSLREQATDENAAMWGTTVYGVKLRDEWGPVTTAMVDYARKVSGFGGGTSGGTSGGSTTSGGTTSSGSTSNYNPYTYTGKY